MSQYTNKQIRDFLTEFFADNDEEFEFFCDDHYSDVKEKFTEGMSAKKRAHILTQHCAESNSFEQLLGLLKENDADKYTKIGLPIEQPENQQPAQQVPVPDPPTGATGAAEVSKTPAAQSTSQEPAIPPTGQEVFISYSRKDETFIKQLHQELSGRGISAWYDRFDIGVGSQWAGEIVKGIRDCQVFLLSLSPDSAASENVRKEVDLAQRYKKRIIPLIWRPTEIPVAMEYQLAGIQWIEFNEDASQNKFDQLADVIQRLIGGSSMAEATTGKAIATEAKIPAVQEEEQAAAGSDGLVLNLNTKQLVSSIALGAAVISGVVIRFNLPAGQQDLVNLELKWLFSAADNFLKIRKGIITRDQPIATPIPATARASSKTNQLLNAIDDFDMKILEGQLESALKRIRTYLRSLDILLEQEALGKDDLYLKNQIKGARVEIVKVMQEMAQLMQQAYGVFVTSPDQLVGLLA